LGKTFVYEPALSMATFWPRAGEIHIHSVYASIKKELAQGEFPIQKGKPDVSQFGLSQFSASFDDAGETSFETYPIPVRISLGHSQKKLTVSKANLHAKLSFSPEDFLPGWGEGFPALRLDQKVGEIHKGKDNVHSKRWRGGLSMSR
jgi:hypothetical protein